MCPEYVLGFGLFVNSKSGFGIPHKSFWHEFKNCLFKHVLIYKFLKMLQVEAPTGETTGVMRKARQLRRARQVSQAGFV